MARIISNSRHSRVLNFAQPERKEIDVFPTASKLNTMDRFGAASKAIATRHSSSGPTLPIFSAAS